MGLSGMFCTYCGRPAEEVGPLSHRNRCQTCARQKMNDTADQIRARSGPHFTHWRHQHAAAVGAIIPEKNP